MFSGIKHTNASQSLGEVLLYGLRSACLTTDWLWLDARDVKRRRRFRDLCVSSALLTVYNQPECWLLVAQTRLSATTHMCVSHTRLSGNALSHTLGHWPKRHQRQQQTHQHTALLLRASSSKTWTMCVRAPVRLGSGVVGRLCGTLWTQNRTETRVWLLLLLVAALATYQINCVYYHWLGTFDDNDNTDDTPPARLLAILVPIGIV